MVSPIILLFAAGHHRPLARRLHQRKSKQDAVSTGDQIDPDAAHKNHLEAFDRNGKFKWVLNLDGTTNDVKTNAAAATGRRLPK